MNAARKQIAEKDEKLKFSAGLRQWQKNSVARRIPLTTLAKRMKCSVQLLRNMLKRGGARKSQRKNLARKTLLVSAVASAKECIKKRISKWPASESRTVRRVTAGLRAHVKDRLAKHWNRQKKKCSDMLTADEIAENCKLYIMSSPNGEKDEMIHHRWI